MKSKESFIIGIILVACLFVLNTTLWGQEDPNEEIRMLREKIKQLENVVETQQNKISQLNQQLNEQTKEIERLERLCSQAGISISPAEGKITSKDESQNVSKITLNQLQKFCTTPMTDLQKEEEYKNNYKGKRVQWTGKVYTIDFEKRKGGTEVYIVQFFHKHPDKELAKYTKHFRVKVEFNEIHKQKLLSLDIGDTVTYQANLPDDTKYLSPNRFQQLTDGEIVSPLKTRRARK